MNSDLTIFLVDDDEDIRTSLGRALTKRGYTVETYVSAAEFLDAYKGRRTGCVLLDYGMPGMNGLELQDHMASLGYTIPIIFITGHGGVAESVTAIKAGAVNFLEKPFRQQVLIDCIEEAFAKAVVEKGTAEKTKQIKASFERLTDREKEVAQLMVSNSSSITSKEIGRELDISPRTVDHHRARIFEKMDIKSVAELVDISIRANLFDSSVLK